MAQPPTPLGWAFRGSILVISADQSMWLPDPGGPTPELWDPESMAPQASGPSHRAHDATIAQQGFSHDGSQGTAFPGPNGVSPLEGHPSLLAQTHVDYAGGPDAQLYCALSDCIRRISIMDDAQVQVPDEDPFDSRIRHLGPISDLWLSLERIFRSSRISQDDVLSRTIDTGPPACHSIPLALRPDWTALRGALWTLLEDTFGPNSIDPSRAGTAQPDSWSVLRHEYARLEQYWAATQQRYIGRAFDNTNSRSAFENPE